MREEVAKKYKLVGIEVGTHHFPKYGKINLAEITLEEADLMYADGFQFFKLVEKPAKVTENKNS